MKITKSQLRRLIKEELSRVVSEQSLPDPVSKYTAEEQEEIRLVNDALSGIFPDLDRRLVTDVSSRVHHKGISRSQMIEELQSISGDAESVALWTETWAEIKENHGGVNTDSSRILAEELAKYFAM